MRSLGRAACALVCPAAPHPYTMCLSLPPYHARRHVNNSPCGCCYAFGGEHIACVREWLHPGPGTSPDLRRPGCVAAVPAGMAGVEAANALYTGVAVSLSEQEIVDCDFLVRGRREVGGKGEGSKRGVGACGSGPMAQGRGGAMGSQRASPAGPAALFIHAGARGISHPRGPRSPPPACVEGRPLPAWTCMCTCCALPVGVQDYGCDGGDFFNVFRWVQANGGVDDDTDYPCERLPAPANSPGCRASCLLLASAAASFCCWGECSDASAGRGGHHHPSC